MNLLRFYIPLPNVSENISERMIASPATRITKHAQASRWEVFLCPEHSKKLSIHYGYQRKQ